MKSRIRFVAVMMCVVCVAVAFACAQTTTASKVEKGKEAVMSHRATGTFDVKVGPLEAYNRDDKAIGRFSLDKQIHGDMEGTSKGEMVGFGTGAPGTSAGYVAIEKFTGKLNGRSGSFALQHSSTMTKGVPSMNIFVVPDSGTGELTGISGKFEIILEPGKHSYVFEYSLPEKQ